LYSNLTNAEATETQGLTAFASNGFSVGNDGSVNTSSGSYVGWGWKANGAGSSNTAGSITSTVSASPTAGFSVVTWTGNATNNATVGHGLGVAPAIVIMKNRTDSTTWFVKGNPSRIPAFTNENQYLYLSLANQIGTSSFNETTLTSSLIQFVVAGNDTNGSGKAMVAYCFAPIAGYSAMGSYAGNGSTNGTFVYTGFRPRYIMIKAATADQSWQIYDTTRSPSNLNSLVLFPNLANAEQNSSADASLDALSNGFKLRVSDAGSNGSGNTYIYMAFAENPFKNSLAR
jgi:hypothetical protein